LPEEYTILGLYASVLPAGDQSPTFPFAGYVVNINVCTTIHRDRMDKLLCLVLALQDCEGGDLGIMEAGVCIQLRSGDMVLFRSHKFSHFNMHYKGRRASIVFHSDSAGSHWADSRNGWADSDFLNFSTHSEGDLAQF